MEMMSYGIRYKPLKDADDYAADVSVPKEALEAYWTKRAKSEELRKLFKQQDETMLAAFKQQMDALIQL